MDNKLRTIQHVSTARLSSSYTGRIHCRQFTSVQQKGEIDESKVANDEIEDAELMAEVQEANERYVVYRFDDMIRNECIYTRLISL